MISTRDLQLLIDYVENNKVIKDLSIKYNLSEKIVEYIIKKHLEPYQIEAVDTINSKMGWCKTAQ